MKILIKNGRVVDPANKVDGVLDILVDNGLIVQAAKNIIAKADKIIDASGKIVMPGLVDMHVHLREPGREDKETISSGTKAALKGGVTTVLVMPNTMPAVDSREAVHFLKDIIAKTASCHVVISGAITMGRSGQKLVDIKALKQEGIAVITDDGASVENEALMLEALKKAQEAQMLVIAHCEDRALSNHGVMNLGLMSTVLGLRGIAKESEFERVKRDIDLAVKAKAAIHIAHVSCRESLVLIAAAKRKGAKVSAETAPHYFALTDEALIGYDTNLKMNPPLRSFEDVEAVRQALKDGVIDCIASDHAPHTENEKEIEFDRAEFGVTGLETELSVAITELIEKGILDWPGLVEKMSLMPAQILKIDKGSLGAGKAADIVIVDPKKEWVVEKNRFVSKSKNSAFLGRTLKGVVEHTLCAGKIAYQSV